MDRGSWAKPVFPTIHVLCSMFYDHLEETKKMTRLEDLRTGLRPVPDRGS